MKIGSNKDCRYKCKYILILNATETEKATRY